MSTTRKYGILIINIGAPETLSKKSIRQYLKRFLSDPRVIEINPLIWKFILNIFILTRRPQKTLLKYQLIWQQNEKSPLIKNTLQLIDDLKSILKNNAERNIMIKMAMNYSKPFIDSVIQEFQDNAIDHLMILPLFPQYSATTVGASLDQVWKSLSKIRFQPEISTINYFYHHPGYINALATHITDYWNQHGKAQKLLFTFHGIPKKYIDKGDPYYQHCLHTIELLADQLKLSSSEYIICFQSRFGQLNWLQPSTSQSIKSLLNQGINSIDIFSPSFVLDCLETLEEIDIYLRQIFFNLGGKKFNYIPCLNNHPDLIKTLSQIIHHKLT